MNARTIISVVFATLLVAYLLFAMWYFPSVQTDTVCTRMDIRIDDGGKRLFVTDGELRAFLGKELGPTEGEPLSKVSLLKMEQTLREHPMLRNADVWCSPEGVVHVSVEQRHPVLRVMAGENYFIDSDRSRMPVRTTTASYVPVITGNVQQAFAAGELFDFVQWMENDEYWRSQIMQVNVVSPQRIELIPRVGSGVVILGSLAGYEGKLKKLRKLYQDGFSQFGWRDYSEVDLRYNGQVVCR